jgi:alpha-amylase/alpha-mannosidase (GH57 family)
VKYVCIHGHFYQPPRENPWLESIEPQDAAAPYHDWNERINAECYAPNTASRILDAKNRIVDIVNNYARISFDFGPTLLSWLEESAPEVHAAVLAADGESRDRFGGHGSALAQAYNHVILPLAPREDKEVQVVWGIRDFERRFGRSPEGMWLPETAVDLETLECLAAQGIRFTVLAPGQAGRVRALGAGDWLSVAGGRIDTKRPYLQRLASGRSIALFFYDGPIARAVAFEGLLHRGEMLARRLAGSIADDGTPGLAHIATDGESYGHHHPHGDMALASALHTLEKERLGRLTNYAEFLARFPPQHEVEILEGTSWSCPHGIERWRSDCGCRTGGSAGWSQSWRAPLRESLDWLRDRVRELGQRRLEETFTDPRRAILSYVDLVLDRDPERVTAFLEDQARGPVDTVAALKLLELERQLQLIYTSCGWFFSDVSGIETIQILRYAGRAVQLAQDLFPAPAASLETGLLERLSRARSNRTEAGTAREIYERSVKASRVTVESLAAHHAISSLFENHVETTRLYCYEVERKELDSFQSGQTKLLVGRARLTSRVTRASETVAFAALHLGGHNVVAGVKRRLDDESYRRLVLDLSAPFERADAAAVLRQIDKKLGPECFDLRSLFGDEQRRIVARLLQATLEEAEDSHRRLYEHHGATIRFLAGLGVPAPRALSAAAEVVLNDNLRRALADEASDAHEVGRLFREAATEGVELEEAALAFTAGRSLEQMAERFFAAPEPLDDLRRLRNRVHLIVSLPLEVDLWKVQNLYFHAMKRLPSSKIDSAGAREWLEEFIALGGDLSVHIESPS